LTKSIEPRRTRRYDKEKYDVCRTKWAERKTCREERRRNSGVKNKNAVKSVNAKHSILLLFTPFKPL